MQPVCDSFACKVAYAEDSAKKSAERRAKKERKEHRDKLEKLKTRSDYMKEAQIAFNAYIRERDRSKGCVSCGKPLRFEAVGGGYDCGHYRSVGSSPHLRFDERNAHGQCKKCNRYGSGMVSDYRIHIKCRIGLEALESLESDQTVKKWTIDELKAIRDEYRSKLKALRKEQGQ